MVFQRLSDGQPLTLFNSYICYIIDVISNCKIA